MLLQIHWALMTALLGLWLVLPASLCAEEKPLATTSAELTADAASSGLVKEAEVKDMEIVRETPSFKIAVHYPVLGVDGIDSDLARWAENLVRDFERVVSEDRLSDSAPHVLDVSYAVEKPSPNAVSVIFEVATYTGGAHGNLDIIARNYDMQSSLQLTLSHLFEDPEIALNLMSSYTYEALSLELGPDRVEDMLKAGTTPDTDNFSTLSLRTQGVRVHFAPYQVAPWARGALFVDMPLEALTDARPHLELWGKG